MPRFSALLLVPALALGACRGTPAGPGEQRLNLVVYGDSVIYAAEMARPEPLQVAALRADTRSPVSGVVVRWRVLQGGAALGIPPQAQSTSDDGGVANLLPAEGAPLGTYRVEASTDRMDGPAPVVEVRVVARPSVQSVQPASITAGGTVTITGADFGSGAAVFFDDVRGGVISATPTSLQVEVPRCLPSRQAAVRVALGAVSSGPVPLAVAGSAGTTVDLQPGGVRTFSNPAELECIRIPAAQPGTAWVLVVHNGAGSPAPPTRFELRGLSPQASPVAQVGTPASPAPSFAESWEAALRTRERGLGPMATPPAGAPGAALQALSAEPPALGSRRDFNVFAGGQKFEKVTAAVRHVGQRSVMYVDVEAATEVADEDLQYFSGIFDDPVYPAMVDIFGQPSDIDGNQRIIILFTPRVNALTPRNSSSFITGFFYGCDLVSRSRCSGTNEGEIFYALVPDPSGRWGDARSRVSVRAAVPPVLAHEFQHMIHYARRGFSSDALWLSEGLAHMAEDLMASVLESRGQSGLAAGFRAGNQARAREFLARTSSTGMLDDELPGTIGQRGAAWLFVKYARLHFGGDDLLRRLTASTRSSVANVVQETGQDWSRMTRDFGVALWASDSPDMAGSLETRYTFPGFSLRGAVSPIPGTFPLVAAPLPWRDLASSGAVAPSANAYFSIIAPAGTASPALNFVLTGHRGAPLAQGSPVTISLVRVR